MFTVVAAVVAVSCLASVTLPGQGIARSTLGAVPRQTTTAQLQRRPLQHAVAPAPCVGVANGLSGTSPSRCVGVLSVRRDSEAIDVFAPVLNAYAPHARSDSYLIASMW
jgi:hypothetical protein